MEHTSSSVSEVWAIIQTWLLLRVIELFTIGKFLHFDGNFPSWSLIQVILCWKHWVCIGTLRSLGSVNLWVIASLACILCVCLPLSYKGARFRPSISSIRIYYINLSYILSNRKCLSSDFRTSWSIGRNKSARIWLRGSHRNRISWSGWLQLIFRRQGSLFCCGRGLSFQLHLHKKKTFNLI